MIPVGTRVSVLWSKSKAYEGHVVKFIKNRPLVVYKDGDVHLENVDKVKTLSGRRLGDAAVRKLIEKHKTKMPRSTRTTPLEDDDRAEDTNTLVELPLHKNDPIDLNGGDAVDELLPRKNDPIDLSGGDAVDELLPRKNDLPSYAISHLESGRNVTVHPDGSITLHASAEWMAAHALASFHCGV